MEKLHGITPRLIFCLFKRYTNDTFSMAGKSKSSIYLRGHFKSTNAYFIIDRSWWINSLRSTLHFTSRHEKK